MKTKTDNLKKPNDWRRQPHFCWRRFDCSKFRNNVLRLSGTASVFEASFPAVQGNLGTKELLDRMGFNSSLLTYSISSRETGIIGPFHLTPRLPNMTFRQLSASIFHSDAVSAILLRHWPKPRDANSESAQVRISEKTGNQ